MREVKFRAWDKEDGKMIGVGTLFFPANSEDSTEVLMQFTGLKDKNGKEIYEGDIICFPDAYKQGGPHIASIEFAAGGFRDDRFGGLIRKGAEVIGNIYENPELLK